MNALAAPRWSPTLKRVIVAVLIVGLVFVIYRAGDIVRPFLWAAILGYILLPVVRAFENRLTNHRGLAAAIVFVAVLLLLAGGVRILAPLAVEQAQTFQRSLPTLIANAQNTLAETLDQMGAEDLVPIVFGPISTAPLEVSRNVANLALPFIVGFSHFLLEFLVFLIATFFFLRDWPRLINWSKRLVPPASRHCCATRWRSITTPPPPLRSHSSGTAPPARTAAPARPQTPDPRSRPAPPS